MALSGNIEQISGRARFQTYVLTTPIISKSQINNRSFYSDKNEQQPNTNNDNNNFDPHFKIYLTDFKWFDRTGVKE